MRFTVSLLFCLESVLHAFYSTVHSVNINRHSFGFFIFPPGFSTFAGDGVHSFAYLDKGGDRIYIWGVFDLQSVGHN